MRLLPLWPIAAICAAQLCGCVAPRGYSSRYAVGASAEVGQQHASALLAANVASGTRDASGAVLDPPLRLLEGSPPAMPPEAIDRRIEGSVIVRIRIRPDGSVAKVSVVNSPSDLLSAAVVDAVSGWRFAPHVVDGRAATLVATQQFEFVAR